MLLVFGLNGQPLPKEYGGPLRLWVPFLQGYKSVKWVHQIRVFQKDPVGIKRLLGRARRRSWAPRAKSWRELWSRGFTTGAAQVTSKPGGTKYTPRKASPQELGAPIDASSGKATGIRLFSVAPPHMRTCHMTWMAFFPAFFGWFGIAPMMAIVRDDSASRRRKWATPSSPPC